ncbi:MAG: winged helix-turn-helix domain-containing protein [Candidatus Altiarchaeota archaeon]
MRAHIRIRRIERPFEKDLERDLDWLCSTFGFCEPGSPESTASRIFREIIKETQKDQGITSTKLAREVEMSRGAVVNHLNNLIEAGLITKQGTHYQLRSGNLHRTIREIERDMMRVFEDLETMADEIDKQLGFKRRE